MMKIKEFYSIDELTGKGNYHFLSDYLKQKNSPSIRLNPQVISVFEEKTGLLFNEDVFNESTVCYALSPEIRQDFKIDFNSNDLIHYSWALLHYNLSSPTKTADTIRLKFPTSSDIFWKTSDIGAEIRNEYQKKNIINIPAQSREAIILMISEMGKQKRIKELICRLRS